MPTSMPRRFSRWRRSRTRSTETWRFIASRTRLRSALRSDPHPKAAEAHQRVGHIVVDPFAREMHSNGSRSPRRSVRPHTKASIRDGWQTRRPHTRAVPDEIDRRSPPLRRRRSRPNGGDGFRRTPTAAPRAGVGTAACGDQRHGADTVTLAPGVKVPGNVDGARSGNGCRRGPG